MSEHSGPFYLKIEQMNAKQFEKQSDYELWHRRINLLYNRNGIPDIDGSEPMQNDRHTFFSDIFLKLYNIIKK